MKFFGWLKYFNVRRALSYKRTGMDSTDFSFLKVLLGIGFILMILLSFPLVTDATEALIKIYTLIFFWMVVFIIGLNLAIDFKEEKYKN